MGDLENSNVSPRDNLPLLSIYLRELWKRCDVVFWVPDTLNEDAFRLVVNGLRKVGGVRALNKLHANPEPLQEDCKGDQ